MELLWESGGNTHCKTLKTPGLPTGSASCPSDAPRADSDSSRALLTSCPAAPASLDNRFAPTRLPRLEKRRRRGAARVTSKGDISEATPRGASPGGVSHAVLQERFSKHLSHEKLRWLSPSAPFVQCGRMPRQKHPTRTSSGAAHTASSVAGL